MIRLILVVIAIAMILLMAVVTVAEILEAREMEWESKQLSEEDENDEQ